MSLLLIGILMGVGGTLAMDGWAIILNRFADQPLPNWAMPGRWLAHVLRGKFMHESIADAESVPNELRIGWMFHYGVGVIYGFGFLVLAGQDWLGTPTFPPIWIFSILTIAAGWFLLQPGMGLGIAGANTPNPWKTRLMGLLAHTAFAIGMWAVALVF